MRRSLKIRLIILYFWGYCNRIKALQKIVYRDFVNESDNDDFSAIYKKRKLPAMLGSETF